MAAMECPYYVLDVDVLKLLRRSFRRQSHRRAMRVKWVPMLATVEEDRGIKRKRQAWVPSSGAQGCTPTGSSLAL
jgi:hypothetical protein